jgi:flagellar basal-body rod protein FlgB
MVQPVTGQLERYLDLVSARQKLTSANLANIDTPGYQTRDIDFQREFLSQVGEQQQPTTMEAAGLPSRNDGNNVNLDRETRLLAENAMRFHLASEMLRSQYKVVRSAIQEGKGG